RWIFDDVHPQYTVALVSIAKGVSERRVQLKGPFRSYADYVNHRHQIAVELDVTELPKEELGQALPLLPKRESGIVFEKMRAQPRFDMPGRSWRMRPVQGDFNSTTG